MGNEMKGYIIAGVIAVAVMVAVCGFWAFVILQVLDILRSALS
jgi:hypothetical protein